jgi:DNA invertase Pin-like site-specific DNA recombinase
MSGTGLLESLLGGSGPATESAAEVAKAIAWARVSTDMQEERGLSIPEQLREIRAYAESHGYEVKAEYHEAASAFQKGAKRREFHKMLAAARSDPEVKAILVHDFSRFSRDSIRAKTLVRELRQQGVRVMSLNDPEVDPETVAGVYMEAITFAKNEAYSREVAFHTRKGCRANVQARDPETNWCYKNGGQPLFGYKTVRLVRGEEKRGRPIIKSIWMLDDTVVAGRPIHEWVRHLLVEMAGKGASLDQLRDFCHEKGIPARRGQYWSTGTWNSLLHPPALAKYCGHEVWNVHRKNGSVRPASEWIVVENAHPAIIIRGRGGGHRGGAAGVQQEALRHRVQPESRLAVPAERRAVQVRAVWCQPAGPHDFERRLLRVWEHAAPARPRVRAGGVRAEGGRGGAGDRRATEAHGHVH